MDRTLAFVTCITHSSGMMSNYLCVPTGLSVGCGSWRGVAPPTAHMGTCLAAICP